MSDASSKQQVAAAGASRPRLSVPWNIVLGLVFIAVVFYGAQIVSGLLLSVYASLRHFSGQQATDWLNSSTGAQFVFILIAEVLTVGAVYLFLRQYKRGWAAIGLKRPRWYHPLFGLGAIPLYYLLFTILAYAAALIFPSLNVTQKQELGFDHVVGQSQLVYTFISLVILPPIAEEIVFRGFIYTTLRKSLTIPIAALITSVLFGAGHLAEGGSSGPLYIGALQTFSLSLVLIGLRELTGNLWAGIVLHASNNLIAFLYLFVLHVH